MKRITRTSLIYLPVALAALTLFAPVAYAYVASSTNYRIQEDSVNVGGGLSTSTNYRIESTVGEDASGTSSSATYRIKAGYQQMQEVYLAITAPGNITLAPAIPVSGGVANGQASWTVITDNAAGYSMTIRASSSPALVSGANNFADYTPAGANPDFTFSVPATAAEFGFTPEGTDIVQRFRDNGVACNAGSGDVGSACWAPLSTTAETIVSRTSGNHPSGTLTTIRFRAESGTSMSQPAGTYSATTTLTVFAY